MDPIIIVFYGALLVVIWLFFIRPQTKKAKEQANFINQIEKGDKVVTSGGIHGRILKVEDNGSILLEVDSNVKMRVERSAISMELTNSVYGAEKKEANGEKK
ncbi:MAG: preprotein translocase subunit YajC [Chitinophagales bacterium]|nr:preprotein translocase subunit YajC [Chitinophagales bacterium]